MRALRWIVGIALIFLLVMWAGTLVHEVGHALVAMAYGARVTEMNVVGLTLFPKLRVHYELGRFGYVAFDRGLPFRQDTIMRMAGSLSTLALALTAQITLWLGPLRQTGPRLLVTGFCFSWLDLFLHTTLAVVGWKPMAYAEAYNALMAIGAPDWLVVSAVIGVSALLLALTGARWFHWSNWSSGFPLSRE